MEPGWYRLSASVVGGRGVSLVSESGFAVVGDLAGLRSDRRLAARGWFDAPASATGPATKSGKQTLIGAKRSDSAPPAPRLTTGVIRPWQRGFGVTVPTKMFDSMVAGQLTARRVADWISDCGAGMAKLPLWLAADDAEGREAAAKLAIELRDRGIEPVGLLDQPPLADLAFYGADNEPGGGAAPAGLAAGGVARWLDSASRWEPRMVETFERLAPSIRHWQVGGDTDDSHVGSFQTEASLERIATTIRGFGPRNPHRRSVALVAYRTPATNVENGVLANAASLQRRADERPGNPGDVGDRSQVEPPCF